MKHASTQTNRMVDIAMMTVEGAETEEAIGSMDGLDSQDQEFQVCVSVRTCVFAWCACMIQLA